MQELAVLTVHEDPTTADGTPDTIAQMPAWIFPIEVDTISAEQDRGNLTVCGTSQPPVERLENEGEALGPRFGREVAGIEVSGRVQVIQTLKCRKAGTKAAGLNHCSGYKTYPLHHAQARHGKLERAPRFMEENMLKARMTFHDHHSALDVRNREGRQ